MKTLVTGASGLLGSYLVKAAPASEDIYGTYFTHGGPDLLHMDITDKRSVLRVISQVNPERIIHCASEGRVDWVEKNKSEANQIIVQGTHNLLWAAKEWGSQFVYISSNAVFKGDDAPYVDFGLREPVNVYGRLKALAEQYVEDYAYDSIIIRPIMLYGWPPEGQRGNFVTRLLENKGDVNLVAKDIVTQPTYAPHCAQAIWKALYQNCIKASYLNIGTETPMSLWDFAVKVAEVFEFDGSRIEPVPRAELAGLAMRPANTTYGLNRLREFGITLPPVEEGLKAMKEEKHAP